MPVRLVSDEELPGSLKGYRLIERLGRGGFGEVWKAEAPGGMHKAVKFVFGDTDSIDEDEARPGQQEEKALHRVKSIRHPYILSLERFDKIDGQLIIVMELAERNLWDRFRECRTAKLPGVPRDELLGYLDEAAEALDLMNDEYQIQHLDVKPQNLFLMHNHVKVADFGLAKMFEGARGTITGGVTPVYAGPETFEGYVSRFTDQYSLAICYQELLTGRRPFEGANTKQLLMQHLNAVPDVSALPPADRPIISRAMSKRPSDRWPSNRDLIRALKTARLPSVAAAGSGGYRYTQRFVSDTPMPPAATPARPASPTLLAGAPVEAPPASRLAGLSGPRLVTPQGAAQSLSALTLTVPRRTGSGSGAVVAASPRGPAAPERRGNGVLFPALVVAVGATGLGVLQALRRSIRERFGKTDAVPSVRFLYLDTDPEAAALATAGPDPLASREVMLLKLNRPTHYLQHPTLPPPEQWLPAGLLYQLPKNPAPADGVRGFGRLALGDHYRSVRLRVRQELDALADGTAMESFATGSGLGVRSNRPRAYVVAGLGGGTGSGMFLDLAYLLRGELAAGGLGDPEAVGVLLAAPADAPSPGGRAAANSYAALAELHHYAAGAPYEGRLDSAEPAGAGAVGPFARAAVLPLPRSAKPRHQARAYALAARGLFTELLTTAARVTDHVRSVAPTQGCTGPVVQAFGLSRLSWPRPELLAGATRGFNRQLIARWAGKESAHLTEALAVWLDDLWAKQKLDLDSLLARFHAAARDALRESPEAVFAAAVDSLRTRTPGAGRADTSAACVVLEQLLKLVGEPSEPGSLEKTVRAVADGVVAKSEADLSALAVSFIEQPQYRLAGAEEALNQLAARLRDAAGAVEARLPELERDAAATYSRLLQAIGTLSTTTGLGAFSGRKAGLTHEMFDALQAYPARRLQLIEHRAASTLYRGLLGNVPDYLREVGFCRARLAEVGTAFADPHRSAEPFLNGQLILPAGCDTVASTVTQIIDALPPEDILAYDQAVQAELTKRFRGLASLCLKPGRTDEFVELLTARTRAFFDERLEKTDPATILLRYLGDGPELAAVLLKAYDDAAPDAGTPATLEAAVLALPDGPSGERVRQALRAATGGAEFIPAPLADDILVYRECPRLPLAGLPQLGDEGRAAYRRLAATDRPPQSRADIRWADPRPPQ
jgi:hypothetical protein